MVAVAVPPLAARSVDVDPVRQPGRAPSPAFAACRAQRLSCSYTVARRAGCASCACPDLWAGGGRPPSATGRGFTSACGPGQVRRRISHVANCNYALTPYSRELCSHTVHMQSPARNKAQRNRSMPRPFYNAPSPLAVREEVERIAGTQATWSADTVELIRNLEESGSGRAASPGPRSSTRSPWNTAHRTVGLWDRVFEALV